jgi:hypothetical protein
VYMLKGVYASRCAYKLRDPIYRRLLSKINYILYRRAPACSLRPNRAPFVTG